MTTNTSNQLRQLLARILHLAAVLLILHALLFALFRLLPSGLGVIFGWGSLDPAFRSAMAKSLGIGDSWFEQYRNHLISLVRFDFGRSLRGQFPVAPTLFSAALTSFPLFVAVVLGAIAGPLVALWVYVPGSKESVSKVAPLFAGTVNLPHYIIAAGVYALYQATSHIRGPNEQAVALWSAALLASALFPFLVTHAMAARATSALVEAPFFITLRAIGLRRFELRRWLAPLLFSAIRPAIARVAIGGILSTAFVEWLFGIPGFGRLGLRALQDADFALMFGWVFAATFVVLVLSEAEQWPGRRG